MRNILLFFSVLIIVTFNGCRQQSNSADTINILPEPGTTYHSGAAVNVKVVLPDGMKPDSIIYLLDTVRLAAQQHAATLAIPTDSLALGPRQITGRVFSNGKSLEVTTNIMLLAAKAPEKYTYQVERKFKHDTSAYTEGLQYADGYLYESAGEWGHSSLRKVDLNSGTVIQQARMAPQYFGEGIAVVGNKVIQLTYKEKTGFVYDKSTLKVILTFPFNWTNEGWGMTYDGKYLMHNDSTNRIWLVNPGTYRPQGYLDVYDNKGAVNQLNEMEYIGGKIYANIYTSDIIVVINPKTGAVLQQIDMKNIYPLAERPTGFDNVQNVLNGIAWDQKGHRLFVTGKKWPYLYQIKLVKL